MNLKHKHLRTLIMSLFAGLLFASCQYSYIEPTVIELPPDPVSYSETIQPAFDANCIACHGGSISPDLTTGNSYDNLMNGGFINIVNPEESVVYINAEGGHPASFSAEEAAYLLKWIEEGAINN